MVSDAAQTSRTGIRSRGAIDADAASEDVASASFGSFAAIVRSCRLRSDGTSDSSIKHTTARALKGLRAASSTAAGASTSSSPASLSVDVSTDPMPARAARRAAAGTMAGATTGGTPTAAAPATADLATRAVAAPPAPTPAATMRAPRMRAIRSSRGGCVENSDAIPLAKKKWLNSAAAGAEIRLPAPCAIFSSAPAMPSGLRVYCTALASARYSRCRLTADWMILPKK